MNLTFSEVFLTLLQKLTSLILQLLNYIPSPPPLKTKTHKNYSPISWLFPARCLALTEEQTMEYPSALQSKW